MSTTIYLLEPGATPPPPRAVSMSARARLLLVCGVALFIAIFLGGLVATLEAGQIIWLAMAGKRITAHITRVDSPQSTAESSRRIAIAYTFDEPFDGARTPQTQYGWADLPATASADHYPENEQPSTTTAAPQPLAYHAGDRLVFRYAVLGGRVILHEWSTTPYGMLFLLGAIGLTLMSVGTLFIVRLYRWHHRRMRLLRQGLAVTGSLVSKRVDGLEGKYYLTYSYLARTDTSVREREEQCTPGQWRQFTENDPVVVLYDPDRADIVGLYKLLADP